MPDSQPEGDNRQFFSSIFKNVFSFSVHQKIQSFSPRKYLILLPQKSAGCGPTTDKVKVYVREVR